MNNFTVKWFKHKSLAKTTVILGVPGIGNISHICTDYLKTKIGAELVCKFYSKYLPNMVVINNDSTVDFPCFNVYLKNKVLIIISNYQPKDSIDSYEFASMLVDFLKKERVSEIVTLAGIGYKEPPSKIVLHASASNESVVKRLKRYKELVFDGAKSVALIIGLSGLAVGFAKEKGINSFSVLAPTWAHPSHVGIKESKVVLSFLAKYLDLSIDFADLNKEIKKLNEEVKKLTKESIEEDRQKSMYIG